MRKQLINDLSKLIKTLKSSKDENDILLLKDLQKIRKVLRDGGDVLDIQNVARWNYSAYFNVDLPENMSLKTYREINNNDISILKNVIMRTMFIQTTTKYRAKKLCPFTPDIIATVCGGFMCLSNMEETKMKTYKISDISIYPF